MSCTFCFFLQIVLACLGIDHIKYIVQNLISNVVYYQCKDSKQKSTITKTLPLKGKRQCTIHHIMHDG